MQRGQRQSGFSADVDMRDSWVRSSPASSSGNHGSSLRDLAFIPAQGASTGGTQRGFNNAGHRAAGNDSRSRSCSRRRSQSCRQRRQRRSGFSADVDMQDSWARSSPASSSGNHGTSLRDFACIPAPGASRGATQRGFTNAESRAAGKDFRSRSCSRYRSQSGRRQPAHHNRSPGGDQARSPRRESCSPSCSSSSSHAEKRIVKHSHSRGFDAGPQAFVTRGPSADWQAPNELELLLDKARNLKRLHIGAVMCYCLENGSIGTMQQAHAMQVAARVLCRRPGPVLSMDVAVIFCISDILHNARYSQSCAGAGGYRQIFQDVLPSVFGKLHESFESQSSSDFEESLGVVQVKQVLAAWRDWEVYPQLFQQGLEAVCFGGAMTKDSKDFDDGDPALQAFMKRHLSMDNLALARYCRNRAVHDGGKNAPAPLRSVLLHRLFLFECYWASRTSTTLGVDATESAHSQRLDDLDSEPSETDELAQAIAETPDLGRSVARSTAVSAPTSRGALAFKSSKPLSQWTEVTEEDEDIDGIPMEQQATTMIDGEDIDGIPLGAPRRIPVPAQTFDEHLDGKKLASARGSVLAKLAMRSAAAGLPHKPAPIVASTSARSPVPEDMEIDAIDALLEAQRHEAQTSAPPGDGTLERPKRRRRVRRSTRDAKAQVRGLENDEHMPPDSRERQREGYDTEEAMPGRARNMYSGEHCLPGDMDDRTLDGPGEQLSRRDDTGRSRRRRCSDSYDNVTGASMDNDRRHDQKSIDAEDQHDETGRSRYRRGADYQDDATCARMDNDQSHQPRSRSPPRRRRRRRKEEANTSPPEADTSLPAPAAKPVSAPSLLSQIRISLASAKPPTPAAPAPALPPAFAEIAPANAAAATTAASDFAAFLAARSRAPTAPAPLAAVPQAVQEKRDERAKEQVRRTKEKEKRERVRRKRKKTKKGSQF